MMMMNPIILIENAQRHFQGPMLGCYEYVPYTSLTIVSIVCSINVSIDCNWFDVSNPSTRKKQIKIKVMRCLVCDL